MEPSIPRFGAVVKRWGIGSGSPHSSRKGAYRLYNRLGTIISGCFRINEPQIIDIEGITIDPGLLGRDCNRLYHTLFKDYHVSRRAWISRGIYLYVMGIHTESVCQRPEDPGKMMAIVSVKDQAVSTSSWYEYLYYMERDGRVYGHLIDPASGKPG